MQWKNFSRLALALHRYACGSSPGCPRFRHLTGLRGTFTSYVHANYPYNVTLVLRPNLHT
jgi:hypothetical protein